MVNIQIPKEAIEYLAFEASLEPDYAEELLQTVLGMCNFKAAEHHAHSDGACPHANTINPLGRVFCPDCRNLVSAPPLTQTVRCLIGVNNANR